MDIRNAYSQSNGPVIINHDTLISLCSSGKIIDAREGGLVLGRSHAEGDICILKSNEDGKFFIDGCLEGGEYLVNTLAAEKNKQRIEEINKYYVKNEVCALDNIRLSMKTRIINTHSEPSDKLIFFGGSPIFIVNKYATAKSYYELEALNHEDNHGNQFKLDFEPA